MLTALTIVFAILMLLAAVLLLAPVRVRAAFGREHRWVRVSYIGLSALWDQHGQQTQYFLLGLRLRTHPWGNAAVAKDRAGRERRRELPPEHPTRRARDAFSRARLLWMHRVGVLRMLRVAARLLGRLWRAMHFESGHLDMSFRSPNPATTGAATGAFWAMRAFWIQRWPRMNLNWQPGFAPGTERVQMTLEGTLTWRIIPVEPLMAVLRALGGVPWRRLYRLKRAWSH